MPTSTITLSRLLAVTVVVGLLLGAASAVGQQLASDAWRPVVNSAGSWTLVAFVAATLTRRSAAGAVVAGVALLSLLAGYGIASEVRGYAVGAALVLFWGAASITVGPVIGAAASHVWRGEDRIAAISVSLMSGVLVGEGVYGLTIVSNTTEPHWWITSIVIGAILLAVVLIRRRASAAGWAAGVAGTAVVAGAFWLVYQQDLFSLLS